MSKVYLANPDNGAPIKNWWDGSNRWSLGVGEVKAFPVEAARHLLAVFGFLQEVSVEEFETRIAALDRVEVPKIKVSPEGGLVPKPEVEVQAEVEVLETKKATLKKEKKKVEAAEDAEPEKPDYWELSRGDLINECQKRGIEIKGLGKKGVSVTKEFIINLLENDHS